MTNEEEQRFVAASTSAKRNIILDRSTSAAKAVEYVESMCGKIADCTGVVNNEVAEKISSMCQGECRVNRDEAIKNVTIAASETNILFDQKINETSEQSLMLTRSAAALTLLSKSALQLREEMHNPNELTKKLHKQIDTAVGDGLLSPDLADDLKKNVASTLVIDPSAPQNSVESIIQNVNKAIRQSNYVKQEELKGLKKGKQMAADYYATTKREFKAMTNADALAKGSNAVGGILTAVHKFQTGDEMKMVSGCLDIANSVAQFLPPPASIITESVSGVFNLFIGGPPATSNDQVIAEVKDAVKSGFLQQKKFLAKKFDEHIKIITAEFQKLETIIKEAGEDLKNYMGEEYLRKLKNDALAQMEAVEEKLIFIEQYQNTDVPVDVAHSIDRQIAALSNTRYSALSKTTFEDICIGILNDDYAKSKEVKRKYCAILLYTYLMVEEDRSIVLSQLITLLAKTPLKKSTEGYLEVDLHRRKEMQDFVERAVLDEKVGCSIFNPQAGPPILTANQRTEMSEYLGYISNAFRDSIQEVQNKLDCSREYIQIV